MKRTSLYRLLWLGLAGGFLFQATSGCLGSTSLNSALQNILLLNLLTSNAAT